MCNSNVNNLEEKLSFDSIGGYKTYVGLINFNHELQVYFRYKNRLFIAISLFVETENPSLEMHAISVVKLSP